ncbi:MAG TPA: carboxypeptidase regulatory-like domain-containing protein [Bryobacteraceae bacterium]|nr:carboxypeptidase regulatory-like domain-containing protein [Bryobacteraceae bacterium]
MNRYASVAGRQRRFDWLPAYRPAILVLVAVALAFGQATTGQFSGTVTDASGGSVPNAKVTVTNTGTGAARSVTTDQTGGYLIAQLPPGTYDITAEAPGFKKEAQRAADLQVNQAATLNFTLQPGQVSETIEVTGAAPQLEAQSSSLGTVVNTQLTAELPLNGRNFVQLATLAPGVSGTGYSVSGTIMSGTRPDDRRPGTEIFSNGNREGSNDFLYDGIDDNDRLTLSIVLRPAVEAIREFKVQTNLFSADQGRNSGAVVDVVTKSGANQIHGSAFEFLRNSAMDARNFFNAKGTPFPSFRYNQFGGSFGGPIVIPKVYHGKDKTFFFMDYEGFRRNQQQIAIVTIPTLAERTGNFAGFKPIYDPQTTTPTATSYTRTQFPGNVIPSNRFDPITIKMINAYPLPQTSGLTNNYTQNLNQIQNWDQGDIRVDHQITANDSVFARYSIQHTATTVPASYPDATIPGISHPVPVGDEASFAGTSFNPVQHAVAAYTHIFGPSLVNDLRVGFQRFRLDYTLAGTTPTENLGNLLGVANSNWNSFQTGLPIFSPAGYLGIGMSRSLPILRRENTFEELDNLTWTRGKHTLRFGVDIRRRQITEYQTNQGNGRFNFSTGFTAQPGVSSGDAIASMLLGFPTLEEQDYLQVWPGIRGIETGVYAADDWRVNKKLTLNIGLRWEYYSPYNEVANRIANFNPATVKLMVAGAQGVSSTANVGSDWADFGPRFGFAYQAADHTVLRGGFGLFYNPNGNGGALLRLDRQAPYGPIIIFSPGDEFTGPQVVQGLPPNPGINFGVADMPTGNVIGIPGNIKQAYAEQFNFTIEQEVAPWKTLFKIATVGNVGRRLGTAWNPNQPVPGPGATTPRRPFYSADSVLADINYYTSDGLSSYYALQFSAEKRLSRGLTGLLGYTWSHSIDDVATDFGGGTGTPQDPRCRFCDRGNSAFDMRQRLTLSFTYQLPGFHAGGFRGAVLGGWQINGLLQSQTGLPFTPGLQTATVNTGTGSRPDSVGSSGALSNPTINLWFNPAAFATPAQFVYGNAGRDILFGPGRTNLDMSLFKAFQPTERLTAQFRFETFNLLNHPQFGQPNATIGNGAVGTITSTVGNPRQMQVALRLVF